MSASRLHWGTYVAFYGTEIQSVNGDGSVDAKVLILPAGQTVDPYDLFVECRTGDQADTNWLARATTLTGAYETKVTGLRLGAGYTLRFGAVAANGAVSTGDAVNFASADDLIPSRLPAGYTELEYIESTDTGNQCVDCGFAPTGRFGFDLDFIGYNAFQRGAYYDKGNRDDGYGCWIRLLPDSIGESCFVLQHRRFWFLSWRNVSLQRGEKCGTCPQ